MKKLWPFIFAGCFARLLGQGSMDQFGYTEGKENLLTLRSNNYGAINNYHVVYHRIELNIDPAVDSIAGTVTTYFIPDTNLISIQIDLSDSLNADSIYWHGQPVVITHSSNIINAVFPGSIVGGAVDSISIYYHGKPAGTGFGSFEQSTHGPDSIPIIWTLSEPYGAKDWWPCKDNLQDKIDSFDIYIQTPNAYTAVSNGLLVEKITAGNNTVYHWTHRYPIATYLVCAAVTNYAPYNICAVYAGDTLAVLNYDYPEELIKDTQNMNHAVNFMLLYDSIFGPYPFSREKYGMAHFGWNGGMEHQTMTFLGSYDFETVAHELAHHWFGDKVTCASWHDIWLNEGFAVYLSVLCYEYLAPEWYRQCLQVKRTVALREPPGSVWCDDTTSVSRIFSASLSYSKAALVLHMLRWELGDSVFFGALRHYLADTNNAYFFAATANLQQHFEAESGRDLSGFFNSWVYGKGNPSYQLSWSQALQGKVQLNINQTQTDPSVSFYAMHLPVLFKNADRDTLIVFNHQFSGESYSFTLPFLADSLIFDPDWWILSNNNTVARLSDYSLNLSVYPNPVDGTAHLHIQTTSAQAATISIHNSFGQKLSNGYYNLQAGENLIDLDVSTLSTGYYWARVYSRGRSFATGFVVTPGKGN